MRPLSWIYGLGVALRNMAFDCGLLKEREYPIPIICVGNITVGGTGKTPHVEYVLSLLRERCRVAVISRGYNRRTKGLIVADNTHTAGEIGDEPLQIKRNYPETLLVVDGNRRRAMRYIMSLPERPDVVVMDDGLQHRYVKPSYRILLMSANRPIDEEKLLPEGRLREPMSARYRMDCIIVSKCDKAMKPIERRGIERGLSLYSYQEIFFSSIDYAPLQTVSSLLSLIEPTSSSPLVGEGSPIVALSAIAEPSDFEQYLSEHYCLIDTWRYTDHHYFTDKDLVQIVQRFEALRVEYPQLSIVCTEKDAMRLVEHLDALGESIKSCLYYLPITVNILYREAELQRLISLATKVKPKSLQDL